MVLSLGQMLSMSSAQLAKRNARLLKTMDKQDAKAKAVKKSKKPSATVHVKAHGRDNNWTKVKAHTRSKPKK